MPLGRAQSASPKRAQSLSPKPIFGASQSMYKGSAASRNHNQQFTVQLPQTKPQKREHRHNTVGELEAEKQSSSSSESEVFDELLVEYLIMKYFICV